jgi:N-methylhydantoinase B
MTKDTSDARDSTASAGQRVDPATLEIVRNQLHDSAEEMQATVMNAAYSPLWQDAGDLSCALLNADAEIVGQSERVIPMHIATMTNSVRAAIDATGGYDDLHPDDVLIQNDPYNGNNHLPDFVMAQPVFVEDILLGFASVRAHWVDVGGSSPTSYSTKTDEIIKEGLRVPPAKLYDAGERNDALFEVLMANMRDRDEREGDMNAQLAGVRTGRQRLTAIAEKYGADTVADVIDVLLANDESRMRKRIAALPDGEYVAADVLDGDGLTDEQITIRATVVVDGDEITVDFDGSDPQATGGVNAPLSCTETATYYAVKVTLDPGSIGTSGSYRPIAVTAPSGTIVNPEYPAPVVAGNHETSNRIYDTVVQSIAEIDPELAFGAGDGSSNILNYRSKESGHINYTCLGGGMGACPDRDGINAIRSGVGNTGIQPVEREERVYDFVRIDSFRLVTDAGGVGEHRGGLPPERVTRFTDDTELLVVAERATSQPFGMDDGGPGASARHRYVTPEGESVDVASKSTFDVEAGSTFAFQPAGGGGYGNPYDRPPEAVREDVENGYVSIEAARDAYGVALDPETLAIDEPETERLRSPDATDE